METLIGLRSAFREIGTLLSAERERAFPLGSVVMHTKATNHWGVVVYSGELPYDKIAILFENGNTWFKEFDEWRVVASRALWPQHIRRMKRKKRVKKSTTANAGGASE